MSPQRTANIELVIKIVTVLVAVFGVWKFFSDQAAAVRLAARGEALKVMRDYSSEQLIQARKALVDFWKANPQFISYVEEAKTLSSNEYTMFIARVLPAYDQFDQLQTAIFRINDYMDATYYCRQSKICDATLLDGFVCDKALEYSMTYGPFFDVMNRLIASRDFGQGARLYAEDCEKAE